MPELGPVEVWLTGGGVVAAFGILAFVVSVLVRQVGGGEDLYEDRLTAIKADQVQRLKDIDADHKRTTLQFTAQLERAQDAIDHLTTEVRAMEESLTAVREALRLCRAESATHQLALDDVRRIAARQATQITDLRATLAAQANPGQSPDV